MHKHKHYAHNAIKQNYTRRGRLHFGQENMCMANPPLENTMLFRSQWRKCRSGLERHIQQNLSISRTKREGQKCLGAGYRLMFSRVLK